jgi:hypothetical protein
MKKGETKMRKLIYILLTAAFGALSTQASAGGIVYLGSGATESTTSTVAGGSPFSFGYLAISDTSSAVYGFDIAREGTMLDSTYGQNSLQQALSLNVLVGSNLSKTENMRIDASALIGMRESFSDCPSSYLGYQCYANTAPSTDYKFNYGVVVSFTFDKVSLGVRATGESTQAILGFRF